MLKLLNSNRIIEQATARYKALPETKQSDLKDSLSNGKALLKNGNQLDAYLFHYGNMHRKKLLKAYSNIPLLSSLSVSCPTRARSNFL